MRRRKFSILLGGALTASTAWRFAARAQQKPAPVIGYDPPSTAGMPTAGQVLTTDLDVSGKRDWVINGATFNGCRLMGASNGRVLNCTFNDQPTAHENGSAIPLNDQRNLEIKGCHFNRCSQTPLGVYNYDKVTVKGCRFIDCSRPMAGLFWGSSNGNSIWFLDNYVSGVQYGGVEFPQSDDAKPQNQQDLRIIGNTFVNAKGLAMIGPISVVARGTVAGTLITDNYCERGPDYFNDTGSGPNAHSEAIEVCGPAKIEGNTMVDFTTAIHIYEHKGQWATASNNFIYNCHSEGNAGGCTPLTTRPTPPLK
jgi:parallel beta helix pectate lyase-like protein